MKSYILKQSNEQTIILSFLTGKPLKVGLVMVLLMLPNLTNLLGR